MKKVIITGAANGIGKALVEKCIDNEFYVIAVDKDSDGIAKLKEQYGTVQFEDHVIDFRNFSEFYDFIPKLYKMHESIDGLVNNAGIYNGKSVYKYTHEDIDDIITVNIKALVYLSKDFASYEMNNNDFKSIVNVTSVAGEVGSSDALYGATKAAVIGLTKSNAWNFAPNIRVNAVSPALIRDTAIFDMIPKYRRVEYERQEILKDPILPKDVANVIFFLLTESSKNITGKIIPVDNGAYPR